MGGEVFADRLRLYKIEVAHCSSCFTGQRRSREPASVGPDGFRLVGSGDSISRNRISVLKMKTGPFYPSPGCLFATLEKVP